MRVGTNAHLKLKNGSKILFKGLKLSERRMKDSGVGIFLQEPHTISKKVWNSLPKVKIEDLGRHMNPMAHDKNNINKQIREMRKKLSKATGIKSYRLFGTKNYPKRIQLAERVYQIINKRLTNGSGVFSDSDMVNCVEDIVKLVQNNYRRRER